jgi:hypothetical protein
MQISSLIVDFCSRLDSAGVPYLIGGSVASGIWGEPRQTNDVDIEIWLTSENIEPFLSMLRDDYLVSESEAHAALKSSEEYPSIQALNVEEAFKFDCFVERDTAANTEALAQVEKVEVEPGIFLNFACAERILIQKLRWYKLGNRVSERQWRDLRSIAKKTLNLDWLLVAKWAVVYGVVDVLDELRSHLNEDAH